jgi:hypothetical protein
LRAMPLGFRLGEGGELVPIGAQQEAIREMAALRAQGKALRAIATAVRATIRSTPRAWRAS